MARLLARRDRAGWLRRFLRDLLDVPRDSDALPRRHFRPARVSSARDRFGASPALHSARARPRLRAHGMDLPRLEPEGPTGLRADWRAPSVGMVSLPADPRRDGKVSR